MAKKVKVKKAAETKNVGDILSKSEQFIDKYQKQLLIGVGAIVLVVMVILGAQHLYLIPRSNEAQVAIFKGENYFAANQWQLALYGDSIDYIGFENIIDEYSMTQTAKLAKAYAGICYYHLGEPEKALDYLKSFSANDKMIGPVITGLMGDCYVDLDQVEKGIHFFEKAASKANNMFISPIYLKKAGLAYESLGLYKQAIESFTAIKNNYPNSQEATDIEKFIYRAKNLLK